jgi:hypothetical protein
MSYYSVYDEQYNSFETIEVVSLLTCSVCSSFDCNGKCGLEKKIKKDKNGKLIHNSKSYKYQGKCKKCNNDSSLCMGWCICQECNTRECKGCSCEWCYDNPKYCKCFNTM